MLLSCIITSLMLTLNHILNPNLKPYRTLNLEQNVVWFYALLEALTMFYQLA